MPMALWKKPVFKGCKCISNYRTFWKRHNYGSSEKIRGCQGSGRGSEVNRWSTGHSGAVNCSVWYCHRGYVTLCICQNCTRQRVNLNINYGLRLIPMYRDWFTSCNIWATSVRGANDGKLCVCGVGCKRRVGTRYFLCHFSVSLKVL